MNNSDIRRYQMLNRLAQHHGTVIFGGSGDCSIPVNELKQYFELNDIIYNRSIPDLTAADAAEAYTACAAALEPECVLLHIGAADAETIISDPQAFDRSLMKLIEVIRSSNPGCEIILASHKGVHADAVNRRLRNAADSCRCTYTDIASGAFNPATTREALSFLSSLGLLRSRKNSASQSNLVRILFNYDSVLA